jgi:serine/threonine protein kinase
MFEKTVGRVSADTLNKFMGLDAAKAGATDKQDARKLLEGIASRIVSSDGRSVRAGNLRLYTGADGQARLTLKRFSHNSHNDQANALIKKLVEIGYADYPEGATQALDRYLETSGNKMGSQSLFKLVQTLSSLRTVMDSHVVPKDPNKATWRQDVVVSGGARIDLDPVVDTYVAATKQAIQAQRVAEQVAALESSGVTLGRVLGQGAMGTARAATLEGQAVVVKTTNKGMPFSLSRLAQRDRAMKGNVGHSVYLGTASKRLPEFDQLDAVVAPTHYLIRRGENQPLELLTAREARTLLKQQRVNRSMAFCEGEVMPMARGEPGLEVMENRKMGNEAQARFFAEMLKLGQSLQGRGLLHRDLKPENMFIDPKSGKLQVFDWDFAYKVSGKKQEGSVLPTLGVGTPMFMSPKVMAREPYAGEADMHSMGMIMLNARYPLVFDQVVSPLVKGMRSQAPSINASNFTAKLQSSFREVRSQYDWDLQQILSKQFSTKLALQALPRPPAAPSRAQAGLEARLEELNAQLQGLEGAFRELTRFERETTGEQTDQSLTSVALQCLRLANENSVSDWYDRSKAQGFYQEVLDHPALRAALAPVGASALA